MRLVFLLLVISFLYSCQQKTNQANPDFLVNKSSEKVFFKNLKNGDTVQSPFMIEMGVRDMKIKPAGKLEAGTGHHHIIVDGKFMEYGEIIPMDNTHLHYGKGDTIVNLDLSHGNHSLTLQFANGLHMSYGEQFSKTINIYVK